MTRYLLIPPSEKVLSLKVICNLGRAVRREKMFWLEKGPKEITFDEMPQPYIRCELSGQSLSGSVRSSLPSALLSLWAPLPAPCRQLGLGSLQSELNS